MGMTCVGCCVRRAHLALAAREGLALCGGVRPYGCKRKTSCAFTFKGGGNQRGGRRAFQSNTKNTN